MARDKSILVLGGTGTLSLSIVTMLVENDSKVTVINRGSSNNLLPSCVNKIIANFATLSDSLTNEDLGSYDVVIDFLSRRKEDIERVFPIFAPICNQYIFISSCCVFNREKGDFPITENSPKPNLNWSYNVEKYEAEQSLISLANKYRTAKYTIVRPYITYDKNRIPIAIAPDYKYHNTIIERIKQGKPMFVINDGSAITTVTYVDDFARAVVGLVGNKNAENEDFNVCGDYSYTHKEVLKELYHQLDVTPIIAEVPESKIFDTMPYTSDMIKGDRKLDAIFDNSKLKSDVCDLEFRCNLAQGLSEVLANYSKGNHYIDYKYDALVDKLTGFNGRPLVYEFRSRRDIITYWLYRLLDYKIANLSFSLLQKLHLC